MPVDKLEVGRQYRLHEYDWGMPQDSDEYIGDIITIIETDSVGAGIAEASDGFQFWVSPKEVNLEGSAEIISKPKFKVGDRVRHLYNSILGSITKCSLLGFPYYVFWDDGREEWVSARDVELVEETSKHNDNRIMGVDMSNGPSMSTVTMTSLRSYPYDRGVLGG